MRVIGEKILLKLKKKNRENRRLCDEIDILIYDLENFSPPEKSIYTIRKDADLVHGNGFYFFNIEIHRTLIFIELLPDGKAVILWAGSHDEYERTFRNNKSTIEKWIKNNNFFDL